MDSIITGDNLLCSGDGKFPLAIKLWNRIHTDKDELRARGFMEEQIKRILSMTHIAKAVRADGELLVFESTVENWNGKKGIQINYYDEWLANYGGKVWHQPIRKTDNRNAIEICRLFRIQRNEMWGLPYESGLDGLVELMSSFEGLPARPFDLPEKKARTVEVFCGEAIAIVEQAMIRLDNKIPVNKWPPMRFIDGTYQAHLIGCKTEKLIRLK